MNEKVEASVTKVKELSTSVGSGIKSGLKSEFVADAATGILSLLLGFAGRGIAKAVFGKKKEG